jgi:creatinine amidohydrolase
MTELDAADLAWPDLDARLKSGTPLILPVGSFEQHGPHLPLATDAIVVEALARAAAERTGALVLPNLPYGAPSRPRSGGGDRFPAPTIPLATLLTGVEALAESALAAGCRYLVVLSWHMENAAVLWDALLAPSRRDGVRLILFDAPWDFLTKELEDALFPDEPANWPADHAGRLETAVMRWLAPKLVGEPPAPVPFTPRFGYDVLPTPADAVPSTGVVLDARRASAEVGGRCFEVMLDGIVAAIEAERPAA